MINQLDRYINIFNKTITSSHDTELFPKTWLRANSSGFPVKSIKKIRTPKIGLICLAMVLGFALFGQNTFAKDKDEANTTTASKSEYPMDDIFDRFFDDSFFENFQYPFREMRRIRQEIKKSLSKEPNGGVFDSWFKRKFGGGALADIQERDDAKFKYYEILVPHLKESSVDIQIKEGQVTVSGRTEKKSKAKNETSYLSSRFHRTFPVPPQVDEAKVEIEHEEEKIIIKFPKT